MNLELQGKVVLVTGGAKGIGEAIVRSFAEEGAIVSIVDRNPEVAEKLIQEIESSGGKHSASRPNSRTRRHAATPSSKPSTEGEV